MLEGTNVMVLDLETARSADDCLYCGEPEGLHEPLARHLLCRMDKTSTVGSTFTRIGWNDRARLGLSIGCYFSYTDMQLHWFDRFTLETTMRDCVERQPLLVSFNGLGHDFPILCAVLRQEQDAEYAAGRSEYGYPRLLYTLCDQFETLCARSYDILAEIWKMDPERRFERGLNSLGAISVANGFGTKTMDGAMAPRWWAQGHYAEVLNYCAGDVTKTRKVFEQIVETGMILRGDGKAIRLPAPHVP